MSTLSKIRKKQKQNNHPLNIQAKNTIDRLLSYSRKYSWTIKQDRCDRLISAIELSLKFWNLRNKDKESTAVVNHYLTKAELFLDKNEET